MKTKSAGILLTLCALAASLSVPQSARASGVTVITHGFEPVAGFPPWLGTMARAVTNAALQRGLTSSWYNIPIRGDLVFGFTAEMSRVSSASAADTAEVLLTVDWSEVANNALLLQGAAIRTDYVASWIAGGLLVTDPNVGLNVPLAARPIHLIGHSRGASAMMETARLLGGSGIWVDHLTTFDPHPLAFPDFGILPGAGDPVAALYENIVFTDNYWRTDINPADFNGQPIPGSADLQLSEPVLNVGGYGSEHSDVHAWCHGTIGIGGTFPTNDGGGGVTIPDSWYALPHPARHLSGFFYSRMANGSLLYRPAFSYAIGTEFGGRHVRATTSRDGGSQWANVGFIQTPASPNNRFTQGQPMTASFKYQDRDSGVRVEWFIDADTNPFNNAGSPLAVQTFDSTGDKVASSSVTIPTVGLNFGLTNRLLAKITSLNDNAVRYDYADNDFTITWPEFVLQSIAPNSVAAGAGVTTLMLSGSGFGVGDSARHRRQRHHAQPPRHAERRVRARRLQRSDGAERPFLPSHCATARRHHQRPDLFNDGRGLVQSHRRHQRPVESRPHHDRRAGLRPRTLRPGLRLDGRLLPSGGSE